MAALSSAQSGWIGSSSTWGGSSFANGDTLTINNGHTVYWQDGDNFIIGQSTATALTYTGTDGSGNPNAVITTGATGKLLHKGGGSGLLDVRGNILISNTASLAYTSYAADAYGGSLGDGFEMNGGILKLNADNAATARQFGIQIGANLGVFRGIKTSNYARITAGSAGSTYNGQITAWRSDLTDTVIENMGTTSSTGYGYIANANGGSDTSGDEVSNRICRMTRVTFDNCGVLRFNNMYSYASVVITDVECLRGLFSTYNINIEGISRALLGGSLRRFTRVRCSEGIALSTTVSSASASDNGIEFDDVILGLLTRSFTNGTRMKKWDDVFFKFPANQSQNTSSIPCNTINRGYAGLMRSGSGNEKTLNAANGNFATTPTFNSFIVECSDDTNQRSGSDAGEFYQHDKEHLDGTTFNDCTFISAEDGKCFAIFEVAALANPAGNNDSYPAPNPFGTVLFNRCRMNMGPSGIRYGHTPSMDIPGTDIIRCTDCIIVAGNYTATTNNFNNIDSVASWVGWAGLDNSNTLSNYTDFMIPANQTGNRLYNFSTTMAMEDGTHSTVSAASFFCPWSGGDYTAADAVLLANNSVSTWNRPANTGRYLNTRPGGSSTNAGRRLRTFGVYNGVVGSGSGSALRDDEYNKTWRALAAQRLGSGHWYWTSGHPYYVSSDFTSSNVYDWIDEDWTLPGSNNFFQAV